MFQRCPACGGRFHVKLVHKKLVRQEQQSRPTTVVMKRGRGGAGGSISGGTTTDTLVRQGRPVIVQTCEFEYGYRCARCGHEWMEKKIEERRET